MTLISQIRKRKQTHHLRKWDSLEFHFIQNDVIYGLWYKYLKQKLPYRYSQSPWQGTFPPFAPFLEAN